MERQPSHRGAELATRLREVAAALIAVVEPIDGDHWRHVPGPGVWSIGKEAEHVAEAAIYHQWIVRLTIGQKVSSRRPAIDAEIEAKLRGDLREEGGLLSMPAAGMPIGGEDVRELIDANRHGR